jgi:hypothetical protein
MEAALLLGPCDMIADVAAEHFDGPLHPHCRELAHRPHCAPALFATGISLIMYLASSRVHHLGYGDESAH